MQKISVALADLGIVEWALATSNCSIQYQRPHPKAAAHARVEAEDLGTATRARIGTRAADLRIGSFAPTITYAGAGGEWRDNSSRRTVFDSISVNSLCAEVGLAKKAHPVIRTCTPRRGI